jgi:hypothetical protein
MWTIPPKLKKPHSDKRTYQDLETVRLFLLALSGRLMRFQATVSAVAESVGAQN